MAATAIICTGALVYLNSFRGQFLFDDQTFLEDQSFYHFWPLSPSMRTRPIVGFSLALNHAISGIDVWSYHAFNLMIHVLASLALFAVVRRTLLTDKMKGRFGQAQTGLALSVALLWMTHPIQTESVTYIIQRAESMMGLFYLLTLYCAIRGFTSHNSSRWYAASVIACAVGTGCKQVIVTAPLIILIYDFVFISGSVKESLRRRWGLYAGLFATWGLIAAIMLISKDTEVSAGFGLKIVSTWDYFKSQFGVIAHYLRLAVYPDALCLDYYWPVAKSMIDVVPFAVMIIAMVLASLYGVFRRSPAGFLGLWFFVILAPTSSVLQIADLAAERRVYVPLAAIVTLGVVGGYSLLRRLAKSGSRQRLSQIGVAVIAVLVAWFGSLTVRRNADYYSEIMMWADVVKKRPDNPRAHSNLGLRLAERGEFDLALAHFQDALRINPSFVEAYNNTGMILANQGRHDEALPYFQEVLRLRPNAKRAHFNIGQVFASRDRWDEAITQFEQELQIDPQFETAYLNIARALEIQKRPVEAEAHYRLALSIWPDWIEARLRLVSLLISDNKDTKEALRIAEETVGITGRQHIVALDVLAAAYAAEGRFAEAATTAREAMDRASLAGQDDLAAAIRKRLRNYEERQTAR
ncbi:MAG: tetratricopeptide repeat protein [Blastocatellia bacterium]